MANLTLVTALFDIGRGDLPDGFKREFSHYLECFRKFLTATKHLPLVVYIEPKHEHVVWEHRERANTIVMKKDLQFLRDFPFYNEVQSIRTNPKWTGQAGWLAASPQATLDLYNPLVMSKQFMLNDASLMNHFDTKYFLWLDAGLNNTVHLEGYLDEFFEKRVTSKMNKMLYLCFPYDGKVEVHGFAKDKMNSLARAETTYVARGGCFGGTKDAINGVNDVYYGLLSNTLRSGLMGTEESLFTILTYTHPEMFNLHMIEGNGLVYKFFEDLRAIPTTKHTEEQLAIYALTFNFPEQFKMFVDSFKEAHPKDFAAAKKYVINNSTDKSVKKDYDKLFEENGFTEFAFPENIGINSARQFAAEHFDKSGHEYMVFFEDDMLLETPDSKKGPCKNGFTRYHPDLFQKAMHIMDSEKLDYLKLSFTEFYGHNHDNWAWFNVPESRRDTYFPRADDRPEKKTKISHTGMYRGLSYAVGQYHYCNWPLVFSKEGNRKVFLDIKWEHLFEQTLMSNTMTLIYEGKVRPGCLLATPINHFRRHHYKKEQRKENKHG